MGDKEALAADVEALAARLAPLLESDRAGHEAAYGVGSFDATAWLAGLPTDKKYQAGPIYWPRPGQPGGMDLLSGMTVRDWGKTATGVALMYGTCYYYAPRLRQAGWTGGRLGAFMAVLPLTSGIAYGLQRSLMRWYGYLDNGNALIFPGYRDDAAPYFIKHRMSDR